MMTHAIDLSNITKVYPARRTGRWPFRRRGAPSQAGHPVEAPNTHTAVGGVTLRVPAGEFFGLLGPNGAGKTTLVRIICTLLEPTSGSATVFGRDVIRDANEVRRRIGAVLTGERSLYWKLSGRENLEYFAALYQIPRRAAGSRIADVLEQVNLTEKADEFVERYSHGMRQRLTLARALLADPPLLVLDEPTIGLDPQAARSLRDLLRGLHRAGKTILLTTHYMEEADQLCDRIGIIDRGKIIALDAPAGLKRSLGERRAVEIEAAGGNGAARQAIRGLEGVTGVVVRHSVDGTARYRVHAPDPRAVLSGIIECLTREGARLEHVRVVEPTLEDVFLALTGRALADEAPAASAAAPA